MTYDFKTDAFNLEYIESEIDQPILWEKHCHSQYEMIGVIDGDITVVLEGQNYRLIKNQCIIIPPLFYHSVNTNEKCIYRRITVQFGIDEIPDVLKEEFLRITRGAMIGFSQNLEKIKERCKMENKQFYAPLVNSLIIETFYDLLHDSKLPEIAETDEFLQKALQYIDLHLGEKILLDDLARHTARSKSSFSHLFEQKMNISPKQYILQKKLALACKLIKEGTPRTVAAMSVGYESYSSFFRLYQSHIENEI